MSRIFGLVVLVLLMALLVYLPAEARTQAPLSMLLGFLLLTGFVFGKIGNYIGLPGITGYLLAGVTLGPSCFGILDKASVNDLSLINSFALTLIALTAGGEVSLKRVRDRLSSFILITTSQVLLTFLGVTIIMAFLLGFFPERFALGLSNRFTVAIFLGIIALANSPSSTVAVIVETGARGRLSELALEITVIKDLVVILAFAFAMAVGSGVLNTSTGADSSNLIHDLAWEIGGSIVLGLVLAGVIIAYMKLVDREIPIFIIVLSFLASKISSLLNVHALLACMTAGVAVNNFSNKGRDFIEAIEKGSLPLYVVFFAIAGADLNLGILADTWQFVGALVIGRLIFTWLGTLSGAFLAREKPVVRDNLWMGFVTQAGVTLGMAVIVADTFGTWGTVFKNVIVGTIAVFQLVGPVLFKLSLARAGEIPAGRRGRDTGETA